MEEVTNRDFFFSPISEQELDKFAFQVLNGVGDLLTLKDVLQEDARPDWSLMTKEQIIAKVGLCLSDKSLGLDWAKHCWE